MIAGILQTAAGAGLLTSLANRFLNSAERAAGYIVATKVVLPKYENLTLMNIVEKIVTDPVEAVEVASLLSKDKAFQRAQNFIDFLKEWNLSVAKSSLKMSIISRDWGYMTSQLLSAVTWSYGFGWLSWVALSPILNLLISQPMNQVLRTEYRSKELSDSKIERLFIDGYISEDEFKSIMIKRGYPEEQINLYIAYLKNEKMREQRDLTKTDILKAFREGILSRDLAKQLLMSIGYDENEAELLLIIEEAKK